MNNTSDVNTEAARLGALHEHAILDTLPEPVFDEIVNRAASICETPIALLSLVDDHRQWFKARVGFALPELPRSIGFDSVTIAQSEPLSVPNAASDPRFEADPLVTSELNIRFYAGVPITTEEGYAIGVLSVMDYTARKLTARQLKALTEQARQAQVTLDLRRKLNASTRGTGEPEPAKIVPSKRDPDAGPRAILPDVMMRFGRDLRYSYVSPFSMEAIGLKPDALLGREVGAERVPVAFADPLKVALERSIQSRRIEEIEFVYMSPSGERLFQTRLMPEISGGEVHAILSITREIVPELREAPPIAARPVLRALLGIAIAESSTIPELLQRCADAMVEFSGAPLIRIWLKDANNHTLTLRASGGNASSLIPGDPGQTVVDLPADADTLDRLAQHAFAFEAADAEARELTATDAFPIKTGSMLHGLITLRDRLAPPAEVHDEILESSGTVAMALRRAQEAEALTEQATSLAKDLLDARLALQRESENSASLAHELRTPLNSVLGLTNLLLGTTLEASQRELGEMTRSSARALLQLVNETLDGPKSEDGDLTLEAAPFNMRQIVEEVGVMLAARAQGKGIELIVRCAPTMPERLIGDAGRLRQILTNLVDNAIKFTREGYVLLDASSEGGLDSEAEIVVEVEDTGIGIAPALQEAVFDRHVRAAAIPDTQEVGSGLGLAISREFAEKMNGTIALRSRPGEGSIFRLILRIPVDPEAPAAPAAGGIAGLRVLIVDGHPLQQFALRETLASWGVRVDLCATVGEMVDAMQAALEADDPFQVVLLDEKLAGRDQRGVISAVLSTEAFKQSRLVILTSVGRNRDVERIVAEAIATSLTKPVRRQPLLVTLDTIAEDLPPRPPRPQEEPAAPEAAPSSSDEDFELEAGKLAPDANANGPLPSVEQGPAATAVAEGPAATGREMSPEPQDRAAAIETLPAPEADQREPAPIEAGRQTEESHGLNGQAHVESRVAVEPNAAPDSKERTPESAHGEPQAELNALQYRTQTETETAPAPSETVSESTPVVDQVEEPVAASSDKPEGIAESETTPQEMAHTEAVPADSKGEELQAEHADPGPVDTVPEATVVLHSAAAAVTPEPVESHVTPEVVPAAAAIDEPAATVSEDAAPEPSAGPTGVAPETEARHDEEGQAPLEAAPAPVVEAPAPAESPVAPAADRSAGQAAPAVETPGEKTFALVVEDDTVNQRVAKLMLEKMGCQVDVAASGNEAIALFETRVYDLVLIDCRMTGMDGYETTSILRKMEGGERRVPIIAVTADTSAGVREKCVAAGMDAYIAKPVHEEDLQYEIGKLLNSALPEREKPAQVPIDDILDRRALLARVAGNTDVLRSLANLCEAECARLMGEIRAAIATGDRSEFLRATHKLRGNIMSMEARAAVEAVRRLELTANQGRPADAEEMLEPLQKELVRLQTAMNAILTDTDSDV